MINIIKESVRGITPVRLDDELFNNKKIFFTGEVNEESASELLKELMYLDSVSEGEEITLCINSGGGEVMSGLAVYDYIKIMKSPVKTVCTGLSASMGAIIFLAGEKRCMLSHTKIMIHDPSYSNNNIGGRKPHEIEQELSNLEKTRDILVKIISERTGKTEDEIRKITENDAYFSADEAVEFGLANEILK